MGVWEGTLLLDASSVIAFVKEARRPDLLQELARRAVGLEIPDTVLDELADVNLRTTIRGFEGVTSFEATALEPYVHLFNRYPMLGQGELGVIARGITTKKSGRACTCVLDDGDARAIAERHSLNFTGTIGLLLKLEQDGAINRHEHLKILADLKAMGFRYDWANHPLDLNVGR